MQSAKAGDVGHKGGPIDSATITAPRMAVAMTILPLQRKARGHFTPRPSPPSHMCPLEPEGLRKVGEIRPKSFRRESEHPVARTVRKNISCPRPRRLAYRPFPL
jgi:hypothetical protein